MANANAPWPPSLDGDAKVFWEELNREKYPHGIDDIGIFRWSSEYRMHRANKMSHEQARDVIFAAIDAIRAGQQPAPTPPGEYDVPWDPSMDQECEPRAQDLRNLYGTKHPAGPQEVDGTGWVRWSSDYRIARANGLSQKLAWTKIEREILNIWGVKSPVETVVRALKGMLRVVQKRIADDLGFRRLFFTSWFPALRILRDDPVEFERQLNVIAEYYQGFRTFLCVGGWSDFWDGREVAPIRFRKWLWTGNFLRTDQYGAWIEAWPDFDDLLRTMLRMCRERRLRLHVTFGDMQIICPDAVQEQDLHRRISRICAEEGGLDVIAAAEMTNEFPINRYGSDSSESIEQMRKLIAIWEAAIPGILTMQGAIPQNEEPDSLRKASTHGDLCAVHVTRSPFPMALKRTFGLIYWEGNYRGFDKCFWQGEPAGNGEESFDRLEDPASLVALYAMHALTGQPSVHFSGPSVRSRVPLESIWGFKELPLLLADLLPEDISSWEHGSNGRGGIEYWWKDKDFRTSTCSDWDPSPPRPIATWTLRTGTAVYSGTGTPPRSTGLLVGQFK